MINLLLWGLDPESHKSKIKASAHSPADSLPFSQLRSRWKRKLDGTTWALVRADLSQEIKCQIQRIAQWDPRWTRIDGQDIFSHSVQESKCWDQKTLAVSLGSATCLRLLENVWNSVFFSICAIGLDEYLPQKEYLCKRILSSGATLPGF